MKKIIFSILSILLLLLCNSCKKAKKNYNDYLPKIKTLSATVQTDGSVVVQGELESEGDAALKNIGFCCGTKSSPEMLDRQIICSVTGNKFSAIYTQLSVDSAYHFRAWATNKYGYSYSNILTLNSIVAPHVTPPCTQSNGTVNTGAAIGTGTYIGNPNVTLSNSIGQYMIHAYTFSGIDVYFYLNSPLSSGIYTTTWDDTPGYHQMFVKFTAEDSYYILNKGSSIYVNTISPGVFDLTICNAPWQQTASTTLLFNTRFTVD